MVILEAALVIGMVGVLVYATIRLLTRPQPVRGTATRPGRWRVVHYDVDGQTRVVLQKASSGGELLDEHLVASVRVDDPDYDTSFMRAMSAARERLALFEAEDEG